MSDAPTADDVMTSPAGVALLEVLEVEQRDDIAWFDAPTAADDAAIERAASAVGTLPLSDLLQRLVMAAEMVAGPWTSDATARLAGAFSLAPRRHAIAAAVAARLEGAPRTLDSEAQEWWLSAPPAGGLRPAFGRTGHVYCCGEFTWDGVWSVTAPPDVMHDDLIDVWELFPGPISRWRVPIHADARVIEVNGPDDWARLVARYPRRVNRAHGGWELPGPNQHLAEVGPLEQASGGRAARTVADVFMPDWVAMAADIDGVHLTWAGMLTCEGRVIDIPELGPGAVSMVRYWRSERTLWLDDAFETPVPVPAPALSGRINGDHGIDASARERHAIDQRSITARLGRDPFR